jgi:hypothetical protein
VPRVVLNPPYGGFVDGRYDGQPFPRPAAGSARKGDALSHRDWTGRRVVAQESDYGRHEPVGWSRPTVFPVSEASRVHAEAVGSLLLAQPEVQAAPAEVVADVVKGRWIAWNGLRYR